jgi:hypothetical protein
MTSINYSCSVIHVLPNGERTKTPVSVNDVVRYQGNIFTVDAMVKLFLNDDRFQSAIDQRVRKTGEQQFWISFETTDSPCCVVAKDGEILALEFWVQLEVKLTEAPVTFAAGRFRETPFLEGASGDEKGQLQFVLVRKPDGKVEGLVSDITGIKRMTDVVLKNEQTAPTPTPPDSLCD